MEINYLISIAPSVTSLFQPFSRKRDLTFNTVVNLCGAATGLNSTYLTSFKDKINNFKILSPEFKQTMQQCRI
ncbi:MAG: hypothetical protein UDM12_07085, partial [Prevotellamassilia sp.]|nr:hypothetical protein [Prevotellamassilia sp.]